MTRGEALTAISAGLLAHTAGEKASEVVSPDGRTRASIHAGHTPAGIALYTITYQLGGAFSKTLYVAAHTENIRKAYVLDDGRLVLLGSMLEWRLGAFAVVDLHAEAVLVEVPCYSPSPSPSGRFIAFAQWFPPHGGTLRQLNAVYRVFDVAAFTPVARMVDPLNKYVGKIVYQPAAASRDNSGMDFTKIHQLAGDFSWSSNSRYTFVDRFSGKSRRMTVTLGPSGINFATIS